MVKQARSKPKEPGNDRALITRLWGRYIWPQKSRLMVAVLFMAALALATAAYTSVVAFIIDRAQTLDPAATATENAAGYAFAILPLLLGITIVSGGANYIQRIMCNAIALNAVADLQKKMFMSVHTADFEYFAREPIGNLMSKFTNDVTVVSNALIRALSNLVKDLLTVIFTIAFMLYHNWQLTLLVCVVYPLAAWPIIEISKRLRGNARDVQAHIGLITSELKESFTGARMVKAYGLEGRENTRMGHTFDERIRLYLKLVTEQARVDPILEVLGGLAIAGVVIAGVWLFGAGTATPGSVAGVLTGLLVLSPRIRALGTLNTVIQEGLAALTRIFEVIDETPTIISKPDAKTLDAPSGHIALENVVFNYPDGTKALRGVSIIAKPGERVALVGESGGGKSTLINLIPRLYDVTQGRVTFDGVDIRDLTLDSLRANLALVSQDITLFNATVLDNIGFGDAAASREDIVAAAKAAAAHDFIIALPYGYDTVLGEDGDTLSGGQRQRLSIARALLRDAPVLLLDEATSALDSESEAKVQAALERLSRGRTTFVIAHRLSTVRQADRIYVLENGSVVETGTHKSLTRKRDGTYARLSRMQLG